MKILVTGATGFIGRNFILNTKFNKIFTTSSTFTESSKIFKHIVGRLEDKTTLEQLVNENFDVVLHFAWTGLPDRSHKYLKSNENLYSMIINEFSKTDNTNHIFLGSCLEYGKLTGCVDEKSNGVELDGFGELKSKILHNLLNSKIRFNWLRIFYVYGLYQHPNSLINTAIKHSLSGEKINLNEPLNAHDYVYIKDVINLIDIIIEKTYTNEIFNVGSGELIANREIVDIIYKYFHSSFSKASNVKTLPSAPGLFANLEKTRDFFNWEPMYSIKDGISNLLAEHNL
jgi:nucleoside-diphosphate-sugar epimerase